MELRTAALRALCEPEPARKAAAAQALWERAQALPDDPSSALLDTEARWPEPAQLPGRPERPELLPAEQVPSRSPFTAEGRAGLLHAICHIEFNAINLALDAVWRFPGMPKAFYLDWLQIAAEEGLHFTLLHGHLATLGHQYGDFPAHNGLWAMAERTAADPLARMALVPRTLEARGLDATPPIQAKLRRAGDLAAVAILDVILRDEVGHVAIGNHWYRWLCEREGIADPVAHYPLLAQRYDAPRLRQPFNLEARRAAGFNEAELAQLQSQSQSQSQADPLASPGEAAQPRG